MADNHSFNTTFAKDYGIEEAILFNDLHYWCRRNEENRINYFTSENESESTRKARFWTYNTCEAFSIHYEYLSKTKIYRILKNLEDKGLIISDEFNKHKYDRTKWYAITDFGEKEYIRCENVLKNGVCKNKTSEFAKMQNGDCQNETTIPNTNTNTNKDSNTSLLSEIEILKKELEEANKRISEQSSLISKLATKTSSAKAEGKRKTKKTEPQTLMNADFYKDIYKTYKDVFFNLKTGGIPNAKDYKKHVDNCILRLREFDMSDELIHSKILEAINNAPRLDYWRNEAKCAFAYIVSETGMGKLTGNTSIQINKGQTAFNDNVVRKYDLADEGGF